MRILEGQEKIEAHTYLSRAAEVAKSALCKRGKRGAIITNKIGVIGYGYNAPPLNNVKKLRCPESDPCCVHAEQRAIMSALSTYKRFVPGSTMYYAKIDDVNEHVCSGEPSCTVCSRLVLDVGIKDFVMKKKEGIVAYDAEEFNDLSMLHSKNARRI